jgi:membrane-associated phospholipid phosphatase
MFVKQLLICVQGVNACLLAFFCLVLTLDADASSKTLLNHQSILNSTPNCELNQINSVYHTNEQAKLEATLWFTNDSPGASNLYWTKLQLGRYVLHKMMPTRAARGLALTHVAMYDTYQLSQVAGLNEQQRQLSVGMAAAQVLRYLFPTEERAFDRIVFAGARLLEGQVNGNASQVAAALNLGCQIGHSVVAYANADGAQRGWSGLRLQYNGEGRLYGPGRWEPTPPYFYYPPDEPFAPNWSTWALAKASEFRPVPPAFLSPVYLKDLQEVIDVNRQLTVEQMSQARFWVDGYGSVTPAGHWNNIAIEKLAKLKLTNQETLFLFALLNLAMADTFVAVWDTKYFYWTARPISVAKRVLNQELKPIILTPPFPSYVSGHAAFSKAAATVIGYFSPDLRLELEQMAGEAAHSRLLGGIHFRHDNVDGSKLGCQVAKKVLLKYACATDCAEVNNGRC